MKSKNYFRLFATCIPVQGYSESAIYDLDRARILPVPNLLYEILLLTPSFPVDEIKRKYSNEFDEGIDLYFNYFIQNEIGFLTEHSDRFPLLNYQWDTPHRINNAIIAVGDWETSEVGSVLGELDALGCRDVQIRHTVFVDPEAINTYLSPLRSGRLKSIELFLKYDERYDLNNLSGLIKTNARVSRIILHSMEKSIADKKIQENEHPKIRYTDKRIDSSTPEIISSDRFMISMDTFFEALQYNTGLNRKICINENGDIKNHFDQKAVFGNIRTTRLADVIANPDFQEKWGVGNDQVVKCKDCPFRYACVSNSDLKLNDAGEWEKVYSCSYDPYQHIWAGQRASGRQHEPEKANPAPQPRAA